MANIFQLIKNFGTIHKRLKADKLLGMPYGDTLPDNADGMLDPGCKFFLTTNGRDYVWDGTAWVTTGSGYLIFIQAKIGGVTTIVTQKPGDPPEVTGIDIDSTEVESTSFIFAFVEIWRGGVYLPFVDPGDGSMWAVKNYADDNITFSHGLVEDEILIIKVTPN